MAAAAAAAAVAPPPHVAVVGGGIVGASIAWHLSQHTNVTVIAPSIGGVATRASFAWLNAASGEDRAYYEFRRRSVARWRELEAQIPGLPVHWGGGLKWDLAPDELAEFGDKFAGWGYDVVRVERSGIHEMEPRVDEAVVPDWALYSAEEGALEAEAAARLMVEHAVARGAAEVVDGTVARLARADGGAVCGVVLADESGTTVEADHVVIAAGLGSVGLLAAEGVDVPVAGRAGMLVNTKPLPSKIASSVVYTSDLHLRQTLDGVVRAGFNEERITEDPDADADVLLAALREAVAQSDELEFDYYTIGERPVPEDGRPIIGPTGLEGVSLAVMHSGVTNAALVGELLTREILTGERDPALDDYLLERFKK
ncbi:hypothetical protein PpBr36_09092 [Pyricularia pennisetigena]|uniref:hypothetical protein n=1 Tax=Pyricularia pennisetigena TaxID=1578925 RepID=UPI0011537F75|nr:hypothetical protein PpBr36_09092 [Pyricularia pennisetigena]TLS24839.1 hypothetical protein PpBr36_09092 [Pyricularia pennisetigena]